MFAPPSDTEEIIDPSSIKVFPNPTSNMLNIELEEIAIEGLASLNVIDMSGKEVLRRTVNVKGQIALDVSSLNQGSYMIHISNSQYMIGKRFSINR